MEKNKAVSEMGRDFGKPQWYGAVKEIYGKH